MTENDKASLGNNTSKRIGGDNGIIEVPKADTLTPKPKTAIDSGMSVLYGKLARVMGKIAPVEKTGQNTFHHYKFQTAEAIANAVRIILAEEGIAFFASMRDVTQTTVQDTKGKPTTLTTVMFDFTFACGETGATITHQWAAESLNNSDKGINQVATAATKYFLMKTFLISTPDEADADSESPERPPQTKTVLKPRPPAQEPAPPKAADEPEPATEAVMYDLNAVINRTAFMYNARKHAENSINAMVNVGEIEPDDTDVAAVWKVFEHRAKSDPYKMGMAKVYEALSAAMEADGSAVPVGSIKQWVTEGKTIEQAWQAVKDYHENANLQPAQPAQTTLPGTPPPTSNIDF